MALFPVGIGVHHSALGSQDAVLELPRGMKTIILPRRKHGHHEKYKKLL